MQVLPIILFFLLQGVAPQAYAHNAARLNSAEIGLKAHHQWVFQVLHESTDHQSFDILPRKLATIEASTRPVTFHHLKRNITEGFKSVSRSRDGPRL